MHSLRPSIILLLFVLPLLFTTGCLGPKSKDSLLDYTRSAELLFLEAMDDYDDQDCISAEPKFQEVRRQFPYSRYAVLSELHIADCQFVLENHAEASVLYEQFVAAHPTHEEAHYAAFRRGLSFVKMIPSDIFIMPPPYERDQSATRDARNTLAKFITTYPESSWQEEARKLLSQVVDALVRHEIYVAEFYLSRDDRTAAAVRLEKVRVNFQESALVPDAMFLQAMTYLELNKVKEAQRVLGEIITYYPSHYQSLRAKDYLKYLDSNQKRGGDG